MSLLANAADFEQGGLYDPPYAEEGFFADRLRYLRAVGRKGQTLAVWGCAYGYLVRQALAWGFDAYGFDASAWAIARGRELHPELAGRLFVRDALSAADVQASLADAGQAKFSRLVTEDMLTCMSDAEVIACLPLLRATSRTAPVHVASCLDRVPYPESCDKRLNWKSGASWKLLVDPDLVFDALSQAVI